jgi:hypothetical protein
MSISLFVWAEALPSDRSLTEQAPRPLRDAPIYS